MDPEQQAEQRAEDRRENQESHEEPSSTSLAENTDEDLDRAGRTDVTAETGEASTTGNVGITDYGPGEATGENR